MNTISRIFLLSLLVFTQAPLFAAPKKEPENSGYLLLDEKHNARIAFERGSTALKENKTDQALKLFKIAHAICLKDKNTDEHLIRFQYAVEYNIGSLSCIDGPTQDLPQAERWLSRCLTHIAYDPEVFYCASGMFFCAKAMWEQGVDALPENEVVLRKILDLGQRAIVLPALGEREKAELRHMLHHVSGTLAMIESTFPATEANKPKFEDGISRLNTSIRYVRDQAGTIATQLTFSPTAHTELQGLARIENAYERALANCYLRLGELWSAQAMEVAAHDPEGSLRYNTEAYTYYGDAQELIEKVLQNYMGAQTDFSDEIEQVRKLLADVKIAATAVTVATAIGFAQYGPTIEAYTSAIDMLETYTEHEKYGEAAKRALVIGRLNRALKLIDGDKLDKETLATSMSDLTYVKEHAEHSIARSAQCVHGQVMLATSTKTKQLEQGLVDITVVPGNAAQHVQLIAKTHLTLAERTSGPARAEHLRVAVQSGDEQVQRAAQEHVELDAIAAAPPQKQYEKLVERAKTDTRKKIIGLKKQAALAYAQELATQDPAHALVVLQDAGGNPDMLKLQVKLLCALQDVQQLLSMLLGGTISPDQVPQNMHLAIAKSIALNLQTAFGTSKKATQTRKKKLKLMHKLLVAVPFNDVQHVLVGLLPYDKSPNQKQANTTALLKVAREKLAQVFEQEAGREMAAKQVALALVKQAVDEAVTQVAEQTARPKAPEPIHEPTPEVVEQTAVELSPYQIARMWFEAGRSDAEKLEGIRQLTWLAVQGDFYAFTDLTNYCLYTDLVDPRYLLTLRRTPQQHAAVLQACVHAFGSNNPKAAWLASALGVMPLTPDYPG